MALQFQRGQIAPLLRKPMGGMIGATQPGFEIGGQQMDLQQPMPAPQVAPKKPGFDWNLVAGSIGDALQTFGGGQGTYAPAMADLQEQMARQQAVREQIEAQARQRQQARAEGMQDWQTKQDILRNNPNPTALQRDYEYFRQQPGNEKMSIGQFMQVYRPQFVPGFDGQYQVAQGGGLPGGYDPEEWEVVEGGPQGSPAGGFRP